MIDSHCHLDHEPLKSNLGEVIDRSKKIGIEISDPDARKHIYGMTYEEWKNKYQK